MIAVSYDGNLSSNMSEKLLSLDEKLIKKNGKDANVDSYDETDSFEMEETGSLNSHRL